MTDITWTVYFDNQRVIIKNENMVTKVFKSNAFPSVDQFSLNEMDDVNVLSFKVDIKVREIKRY